MTAKTPGTSGLKTPGVQTPQTPTGGTPIGSFAIGMTLEEMRAQIDRIEKKSKEHRLINGNRLDMSSSPSLRKTIKRSSKQTPRCRDTPKKTNTAGRKVNALARYFEKKKEKPVVPKISKIMPENNVLSMFETPLLTFGAPNTRK